MSRERRLIIIFTVAGLVLATLSVAHSVGMLGSPPAPPATVVVSGSVTWNGSAINPTVTFIDQYSPLNQSVFAPVTSHTYSLTVRNQHSYLVHLYYTVQTNDCYTNQAGYFVRFNYPESCYKGPIYINVSTGIMGYDIDCLHANPCEP